MNQNGWGIYIGKNSILGASKNDRGDTAYVNRKNINSKDTLFIHEYICGGTIKPPKISLHILKDDAPYTNIELTYINGTNFYPLNKLNELYDFEKLIVEIHSSFNYYYPQFDQNKPMATLIIA